MIKILILAASCALAAPSSLEMSEKYSQDLQKRFQEHLTKTFGAGKSEVFVNVELGFSDDLKKDFQQALRAFLIWQMELMQRDREKALAAKQKEEEGEESETYGIGSSKSVGAPKSQEEAPAAATDNTDTPDSTAPPYILPGYVLKRMAALSELSPSDYNAPEAPGGNGPASPAVAVITQGKKEDANASIQPVLPFYDTSFLYSISSQVKRVMIRVVLDESLPSDAETKVQSLISTMSDFDPGRGDQLIMNRMMLVPTKPRDVLAAGAAKLFGEPQFLGPLLQWVLMGGILFFGIVMGSLVLRNLSLSIDLGSLPSWLGGALNIVHQGQQERAAALAAGGAVGAETLPIDAHALPSLPSLRPALAAGAIEIPLDRIGDLYSLVGRADPSRIALIASRLKPEVSAEFLKRFDGDRMAQILAAMASPQYVDPAILSKLKDEVERRMQGLVGGQEDLLRVFSQPDQRARVRMLEALEQRDPKLFREMRSKVLLMTDLDKFEDHDLSAVLQKAAAEDLAILIRDEATDQTIKDKILRCLARRTAQVVMERGSLGEAPSADAVSQVQGRILLTAERMMAQGIIKLAEGATGAANV